MCEGCMHLEYDDTLKEYVCSVITMMDEDDYSRMSSHPHKHCPYYKVGDEYTWIRKQNE